jgi:hypothetical protein
VWRVAHRQTSARRTKFCSWLVTGSRVRSTMRRRRGWACAASSSDSNHRLSTGLTPAAASSPTTAPARYSARLPVAGASVPSELLLLCLRSRPHVHRGDSQRRSAPHTHRGRSVPYSLRAAIGRSELAPFGAAVCTRDVCTRLREELHQQSEMGSVHANGYDPRSSSHRDSPALRGRSSSLRAEPVNPKWRL